jgi:hypothetical protein
MSIVGQAYARSIRESIGYEEGLKKALRILRKYRSFATVEREIKKEIKKEQNAD